MFVVLVNCFARQDHIWIRARNTRQLTCDNCGEKFCYCCGLKASELTRGFVEHNQWYLGIDENAQKCPLYLQYRWGDRLVANQHRLDGDPGLALERFHRDLQIDAMIKLKEELKNDELWAEMERKKFPNQPLIGPKYDPEKPSPPDWKFKVKHKVENGLFWGDVAFFLLYIVFYIVVYSFMIYEGKHAGDQVNVHFESQISNLCGSVHQIL
jgi:hypothetical protein